jgi:PAS domain-containing protein
VAVEPVLIVESGSRRIARANPAAAELLRIPEPGLIGRHVTEAFDASSMEAVMRSMDAAHSEEPADEVICRSAGGGSALRAHASLFRAETGSYLLVRLSVQEEGTEAVPESPVFDAIESAPVSFLLTDAGFRVEYANQAFADLVELPPPAAPRGKSLLRWLELTAADLARLRDQMLQRQACSVLTTMVRPQRGAPLEVEICAVAVPDGPHVCWGFTIRELPRLN